MPADEVTRDKVLLAVMGSPDERQIDGIGGATTLTSKIAILSASNHPWADVDFLFAQVSVATHQIKSTDQGAGTGDEKTNKANKGAI